MPLKQQKNTVFDNIKVRMELQTQPANWELANL